MLDVNKTIISQYKHSPNINQIIIDMNKRLDPRATIDMFISDVLNIRTAKGWGLDNWGRILNVKRTVNLPNVEPDKQFGYLVNDTTQSWFGFNQAPFNVKDTTTYYLTDEEYRILLLLKAAINISDCSIGSIANALNIIFNKKDNVFIQEIHPMSIRFIFKFYLSPLEIEILKGGFIPRPAGVGIDIFAYEPSETFGFNDPESYVGFNVGTFYS